MCLSWGCVWWVPYVTFVSNNVIRTNIITSDRLDLFLILGNNAKAKIWVISLVIDRDGLPTLVGMNDSTVAKSSKKTHFIPSNVRPWLHSFRWRQGSGEATSWPAVRPPNGRGEPGGDVWKHHLAVKYVKWNNVWKMALWIFNFSWMSWHSLKRPISWNENILFR